MKPNRVIDGLRLAFSPCALFLSALVVATACSATASAQWGIGWGYRGSTVHVQQSTQLGTPHASIGRVPYRPMKQTLTPVKRAGTFVHAPPAGSAVVRIGDKTYWQSGSHFYLQEANGFVVVPPPIGAQLERVPLGTPTVKVDGVEYFHLQGTFVRNFTIVPAPIGAIVHRLPVAGRVMTVGGKKYYEYGGAFYRRFYKGSTVVYKVVKAPPAPASSKGAGQPGKAPGKAPNVPTKAGAGK